MRHSDRPILNPDEDRLGRVGFSHALARSIDRLAVAKDGFVIALIGTWGAGKSSAIELTLRALKHEELLQKAHQLYPNRAYTYSDIEGMWESFKYVEPAINKLKDQNLNVELWERNQRRAEFESLCKTIEDADRAEVYCKLLQEVEASPRNLLVRFSPWLIPNEAELASALLSDLARGVGEKLGSEVTHAFASLLGRLAEISSLMGTAADILTQSPFGSIFSTSLDVSNKLAKRMTIGPTLENVRSTLQSSLGRLREQKIVVVMDDLDRLSPKEAVEIIKVLKGLGRVDKEDSQISFALIQGSFGGSYHDPRFVERQGMGLS